MLSLFGLGFTQTSIFFCSLLGDRYSLVADSLYMKLPDVFSDKGNQTLSNFGEIRLVNGVFAQTSEIDIRFTTF